MVFAHFLKALSLSLQFKALRPTNLMDRRFATKRRTLLLLHEGTDNTTEDVRHDLSSIVEFKYVRHQHDRTPIKATLSK